MITGVRYLSPYTIRPGDLMYIDPTTGSLVLQVLAAGTLATIAMASRARETVKSFFKRLVSRRGRWAGKP